MNKLDGFDILSRASGEISVLAEQCDIDWSALCSQISHQQTVYKRGIAIDKKSRGKVCAFVNFNISDKGYESVTITFNSFRNGGKTAKFSSYEWKKDNGYFNKDIAHIEPAAKKVIHIAKPKKSDTNKFNGKMQRFNAAKAIFDNLPVLTDVAGTYFDRKGFKIENITNTGIEFKRGYDNRGGFIRYALRNEKQAITGFQSIYDASFIDYEGVSRDKDFIFYPVLTEENELKTLKKGSYAFLGKPKSKDDLLFCAEGLATGISVFIATGTPCVICLDAGNIAPVVNSLSEQGYGNLTIAADNDIKEKNAGNVGIYQALKSVRYTDIKIVIPTMNGKKCDFDDLRSEKGIEEVILQLANNRIPTYSRDSLEHHCALIKYAPSNQLEGCVTRACSYAARYQITTVTEYRSVYKRIKSAAKDRNFDKGNGIRHWLRKYFNKKLDEIKAENQITDFSDVTCHDFTGKNNTAIANKIISIGKGIFIDNRPMATGKTDLMKLIADYHLNRVKNNGKAKYADIKQYHFDNGGNAKEWDKISNNPKLFKTLEDEINLQRTTVASESKKTVYVCHRISLTSSASERLELTYYDDIQSNETTQSLAVCVNSMPKHEVSETVKVLFIDEARQNIEHTLNGTVHNRLGVDAELKAAIQNADLVIFADADFNDFTLNWIKSIANKPIHAITQNTVKTNKTLLELGNSNAVLIHAKESLKKGQNVWLSTDSMKQASKADIHLKSPDVMDKDTLEAIMSELINGSGISDDDVLLVHSENKGDVRQAAFLKNPNEESKKYRLIIHTPVISSGISITNSHFQSVYAIFCNVLSPNEMLQTIARVRTAKEIFVCFKSNHPKDRPTNNKDLLDGHTIKVGRFNSDKFITEYDEFDRLRLEQIATKNAALNDYRRYFIILAQLKGYSFKQYDLTRWTISGLGKAATAQKINQIFTASEIDADIAAAIDLKSSPTQQETDCLHRYKVTQMTGKSHSDVDEVDIAFYMDNGLSKISNFELVNADVTELKDSDIANHNTRDKLSSKTSKNYIFQCIVSKLLGKRVNARGVQGLCKFLQEHHKELASNNMGNYAKLHKYPIKQMNDFLKKIGYELVLDVNSKNTEQSWRFQPNPLVESYAKNRAEIADYKLQTVNSLKMALS